MALSTQPYKGARDFYPEDKRLQKYIFSIWRSVCESYGYEEYDAPLLEPLELYQAKTGDEIVNEQTYTFTDRGDRKVVIRPEMTPTVSRMVAAKRQELAYPLRWYSIPNLWRYERPQRGRLREHWQLNVDLFGVEAIDADFEVIQVADAIMKAFGASQKMYEVRINSRKLVDEVLDAQGLDAADKRLFLNISDKWHKFGSDDERLAYVDKVLKDSGYGSQKQRRFMDLLSDRKAMEQALDGPAGHKVKSLLKRLTGIGINAKPDFFLARGFDYYRDVVFEIFDTNKDNNRSLFGGGRYDGLVGLFGVEPVPTVGFGMGDVTLLNFLEVHKLLPKLQPEIDAYVVLVGDVAEKAQPLLKQLRTKGLKLAVDYSGRKADKQLKMADKRGIPYAIFIGDKELADSSYTLKNLHTGKEAKCTLPELVSLLLEPRKTT